MLNAIDTFYPTLLTDSLLDEIIGVLCDISRSEITESTLNFGKDTLSLFSMKTAQITIYSDDFTIGRGRLLTDADSSIKMIIDASQRIRRAAIRGISAAGMIIMHGYNITCGSWSGDKYIPVNMDPKLTIARICEHAPDAFLGEFINRTNIIEVRNFAILHGINCSTAVRLDRIMLLTNLTSYPILNISYPVLTYLAAVIDKKTINIPKFTIDQWIEYTNACRQLKLRFRISS